VIAVPSGITEVEKRAVRESATTPARAKFIDRRTNGGGDRVSGLPVQDPAGNMIIDIGGGTTEWPSFRFPELSSAAVCAWRRRAR